jgi:hypothetical protein
MRLLKINVPFAKRISVLANSPSWPKNLLLILRLNEISREVNGFPVFIRRF